MGPHAQLQQVQGLEPSKARCRGCLVTTGCESESSRDRRDTLPPKCQKPTQNTSLLQPARLPASEATQWDGAMLVVSKFATSQRPANNRSLNLLYKLSPNLPTSPHRNSFTLRAPNPLIRVCPHPRPVHRGTGIGKAGPCSPGTARASVSCETSPGPSLVLPGVTKSPGVTRGPCFGDTGHLPQAGPDMQGKSHSATVVSIDVFSPISF